MKEHYELDLFDNAIDSLNEAINKFEQCDLNDKALKFAILHVVHFVELFLKYYVSQEHELLIYFKPFEKINADSKTIGLNEIIKILTNAQKEFSESFLRDLHFIKKLRNDIEHHKFSMNIEVVQTCIGRILNGIIEFDEFNDNFNMLSHVDKKYITTIEALKNGYITKLERTQKKIIDAESDFDSLDSEWFILECNDCGQDAVIPYEDSQYGYKCMYCDQEEDYSYECPRCHSSVSGSDREFFYPCCSYCDNLMRKDD